MPCGCRSLWVGVVIFLAAAAVGTAAEPTIDLELVTEAGFRGDLSRQWYTLFEELNIRNVRIRGIQVGDGVKVEPVGDPVRTYRIMGVLTTANQLKLAGAVFSVHDKAKIGGWIAKVKEGGVDGLFEKPVAFGLGGRQFAALKQSLAARVTFATAGESSADLAERLIAEIVEPIRLDEAARMKLRAADKFRDDLTGLSVGTVLAAVIRPAGLVLAPEKVGAGVKLSIADSRAVKEPWPIGWTPERTPRDYVPDLLSFLNVEIADTPLTEVIAAVKERLKVPVIIDQNSLARERVDLAATKVTLPKMKTYYQKILDRALFQAKLKMELRLDEAQQPFLWITTIKQ